MFLRKLSSRQSPENFCLLFFIPMSDDRSRKRKWDVHEPSNDNVKRVSMSPSQVKSSDTGKETLSEQEKVR